MNSTSKSSTPHVTMEKHPAYYLIPSTAPGWITIIEYGIIGFLGEQFFNELELPKPHFLWVSTFIAVAIIISILVMAIKRKFILPKTQLGLFFFEDKFIYHPTDAITIETNWENVVRIEKTDIGMTGYVVPILKDAGAVRLTGRARSGMKMINKNLKKFGMPIAINPYSVQTSVYDLLAQFKSYLK